jgi:diacylglycerol kinase (ATP)
LLALAPLAFFVGCGGQVALLAGTAVLVLIVELLNSSIEAAIDRVSLDLHDLSKQAKDRASAAVLLSLLLCAAVWAAALWQRFAAH